MGVIQVIILHVYFRILSSCVDSILDTCPTGVSLFPGDIMQFFSPCVKESPVELVVVGCSALQCFRK